MNPRNNNDQRGIEARGLDRLAAAIDAKVSDHRSKAKLADDERQTLLAAATVSDGSLLLDCVDDLLTIRLIDGELAGIAKANEVSMNLPLTSVGPSGIGGEYQSETHPDRVLQTPVTEAERLEDIRICQSGEASPEQLSLLRWLATKAVAGELDGWGKFNREVNEVIRLCGKWGRP